MQFGVKTGYGGFEASRCLAALAPDLYELVHMVKMAQQPTAPGATTVVPPAASASATTTAGGAAASGGAEAPAPSPTFLGDENSISEFANRISEIIKRLWNNEYGRTLLLGLLVGGGGGGLLELIGGGRDTSISSTLRSILIWGILGVILGVGGKFINDWIISGKSSTDILKGAVKDVLGESFANYIYGIDPAKNPGKELEKSLTSLQKNEEKSGPALSSVAGQLKEKERIKQIFYANLMNAVDEKQKSDKGWFASFQKMPEQDRAEETKKFVTEAWEKTKRDIIKELRDAYIESPEAKKEHNSLYSLDKYFDENFESAGLIPTDSVWSRLVSPSTLAMVGPAALVTHGLFPTIDLFRYGLGRNRAETNLGMLNKYLTRDIRNISQQFAEDPAAAAKSSPVAIDVLRQQHNRQWSKIPLKSHSGPGAVEIDPDFSSHAGALIAEKPRPFWSRVIWPASEKAVAKNIYKNLVALSSELPGYSQSQIERAVGLTPAQKGFLLSNTKDQNLLQSLLHYFEPSRASSGRITSGGHIPHLIEFFDDNKTRHLMTARQLLNLRRDLWRATAPSRRSYWLPRLALTLNPRGPYWSAGLVWGIPLIASALMPHYFSSPEAHINRIAKNIEPAYGAEVVSKVDPSLLDRMYREFQKSK